MEIISKVLPLTKLENNTGQIEGVPKNPRFIKDYRYHKLKQSIVEDPEMLDLRELLVFPMKEKFVVIAGNQRLAVCRELKFKETLCKILPADTPIEKLKRYIIKDNVSFGESDYELLANEWDEDQLSDWGLEIPDFEKVQENEHVGEYNLASELTSKMNYIVLVFENKTDWNNALSIFDLETEKTLRKNGKEWARGIGRVINGSSAINKIRNV